LFIVIMPLHLSQVCIHPQGWVLSAFFYGYVLTGYLGGYLATKYGGYYVLNAAVAAWSVLTYFTPACARFSLHALLACRVLLGVVQASHVKLPCIFPQCLLHVPRMFPKCSLNSP
jgi:MFS family permease